MGVTPKSQPQSQRLLDLIERRFGLLVADHSPAHLASVRQHYLGKRAFLLQHLGEADALRSAEYAKAVLISEAARMILREIEPHPRKRKKNRKSQ